MAKTPGLSPASEDLGWSLGILLRRWHERVEETVADLPHGPRGYQILSAVVRNEPPTQVALAAHLGIDRTVITYLIDSLVEAGLVERKQDAADRRARRIVATAKGLRALRKLQQQVAVAEQEILGHLGEEEQRQLREGLRQAAMAVHTAHPGIDACEAVATVLAKEPRRA